MRKIRILSGFHLKILAMILMIIDHVGYYFYNYFSLETYEILRTIGRLCFPIYAFLLVEGIRYSKKPIQYLASLFVVGAIIDIVSAFVFPLNNSCVLITFVIAGSAMLILDKAKGWFKLFSLIPLTIGYLSGFSFFPLKVDYGIYGITLIMLFYIARKFSEFLFNHQHIEIKNNPDFTSFFTIISSLLFIAFTIITSLLNNQLNNFFEGNNISFTFQSWAVLSIVFILLYNGKRGYNAPWFKWSCYLFYPIHFVLLFLIGLIL